MLADPQSITISGTAISHPRVLSGTTAGKFVAPNSNLEIEQVTTKNGRRRTAIRLTQKKVTADPLIASTNVLVDDTITIAINRPLSGFSDADVLAQLTGLVNWLSAGTYAVAKQVIAGEN